jgi:cell shape-determining protein MreC
MIKKYIQSYFTIVAILAVLLLIPKHMKERVRELAAWGNASIYQKVSSYQHSATQEQLEQVKLENTLLSHQLQDIGEYLASEERLDEFFKKLEVVHSEKQEVIKRRENLLLENLRRQLESLGAKVVYRDPSFWSHFLWIDVGQKDNEILGHEVVCYNSPVVVGSVIIGVIDYVGQKQSRVRLVTDSSVITSVRVGRGMMQNHVLLDRLNLVLDQLKFREDVFFSAEEQENTLNILKHLRDNIQLVGQDCYLAKGELHGAAMSVWKYASPLLAGVGFNYDYSDEEGPARDLRTEHLLKEGDLLVTTGMDGVFPEGFQVAVIDKVKPLEEGAASYELQAKSLIENFHEIHKVRVLAPLKKIPFELYK